MQAGISPAERIWPSLGEIGAFYPLFVTFAPLFVTLTRFAGGRRAKRLFPDPVIGPEVDKSDKVAQNGVKVRKVTKWRKAAKRRESGGRIVVFWTRKVSKSGLFLVAERRSSEKTPEESGPRDPYCAKVTIPH